MQAALPTGPRGRALALALTVAVLGALWAGVASPLIAWYDDRAAALEQRRVLAAHMEDLVATLPALQGQERAATANGPPPVAVVEGATDAIAGAALQDRVQALATEAGAKLSSLETLAAEQRGSFRRIGIRVSLAGRWPTLVALLRGIEGATPRMLVDDLQLRAPPVRVGTGEVQVNATFTVLAFRAGSQQAAAQ